MSKLADTVALRTKTYNMNSGWELCLPNIQHVGCLPQKITTKNAFGLHLIDYMADILKQKDSEITNFKVGLDPVHSLAVSSAST
jgi:hypothetical protein